MNFDFPLIKASGFLDIQQIPKHYFRNTIMVPTRDIPSLETLRDNMPFPDEDDNTTAYPTYLSVLVLVARNTTSGGEENKSQVVGYVFLVPGRKSTMGVKNLALEAGKWIDTACLRLDVPDDAGDGDSSSDNDSGYGGGDGDGEGSEAGSVESEGSVGSEGSAASYGSHGSEGSQTSVSSAGSGHNSDDDENENEDSEDEENDWDDDDDPYGEVDDDDFEFD